MEQYIIKGGNPLVGEVEIGGAKNAALAILAAAIMTDETVLIDNLPDVNISRRSGRHIICWVRYSASTRKQLWRFRADAISEAVRSTSI